MSKQRPQNFIFLAGGLIFLVLVMPLYRDLTDTDYLYLSEVALSVFLILGIWTLQQAKRWFPLAIALVIVGVLGNLLSLQNPQSVFSYLSLVSYIAFLGLAVGLAAIQVFRSPSIALNNIVGAICIYLLLALIWALFYVAVNLLVPGSFGDRVNGSVHQQMNDLLYFSLVTLTSLGYGDITPTGAAARALATLQVMAGQFYIAVLVAGLVAAYLQRGEDNSD